jgi:hypothetical protein
MVSKMVLIIIVVFVAVVVLYKQGYLDEYLTPRTSERTSGKVSSNNSELDPIVQNELELDPTVQPTNVDDLPGTNDEEEDDFLDPDHKENPQLANNEEEEELRTRITSELQEKVATETQMLFRVAEASYPGSKILMNAVKQLVQEANDNVTQAVLRLPLSTLRSVDCGAIVTSIVKDAKTNADLDMTEYEARLALSKNKLFTLILSEIHHTYNQIASARGVTVNQIQAILEPIFTTRVSEVISQASNRIPDGIIDKTAILSGQMSGQLINEVWDSFGEHESEVKSVNVTHETGSNRKISVSNPNGGPVTYVSL